MRFYIVIKLVFVIGLEFFYSILVYDCRVIFYEFLYYFENIVKYWLYCVCSLNVKFVKIC